jgi:hypothetical protein
MRLAPEIPFPPYSFVPGQAPHPTSDPAGHSHGVKPAPVDAVDPDHWHASRRYLHALDLFNEQYYWEAHEQFEQIWLAAGRQGPVANLLKGLIKLSAAGVKHREGKPQGVRSHAGRAAEIFRGVGREGLFLGLSTAGLVELAEEVVRTGWPDTPPTLAPVFA